MQPDPSLFPHAPPTLNVYDDMPIAQVRTTLDKYNVPWLPNESQPVLSLRLKAVLATIYPHLSGYLDTLTKADLQRVLRGTRLSCEGHRNEQLLRVQAFVGAVAQQAHLLTGIKKSDWRHLMKETGLGKRLTKPQIIMAWTRYVLHLFPPTMTSEIQKHSEQVQLMLQKMLKAKGLPSSGRRSDIVDRWLDNYASSQKDSKEQAKEMQWIRHLRKQWRRLPRVKDTSKIGRFLLLDPDEVTLLDGDKLDETIVEYVLEVSQPRNSHASYYVLDNPTVAVTAFIVHTEECGAACDVELYGLTDKNSLVTLDTMLTALPT